MLFKIIGIWSIAWWYVGNRLTKDTVFGKRGSQKYKEFIFWKFINVFPGMSGYVWFRFCLWARTINVKYLIKNAFENALRSKNIYVNIPDGFARVLSEEWVYVLRKDFVDYGSRRGEVSPLHSSVYSILAFRSQWLTRYYTFANPKLRFWSHLFIPMIWWSQVIATCHWTALRTTLKILSCFLSSTLLIVFLVSLFTVVVMLLKTSLINDSEGSF